MSILAIDQGTSGTKAIVVDGRQVLAVVERAVRPRYLAEGGVEQDPAELLQSVVDAGREAVSRAGSAIDAVALANQGETVLAWDQGTGEPLTVALSWQDRRSESICAELADRAGELAARTGLVLDPYFSAPKMAWLRRNSTTSGVVTTTDSWLVHRLTGEFVTDVTTASRSLVFGLDEMTWQADLLEAFGLGAERLPRIVDNDEIVGTTSAFGADIPVAGLVVDQQAALLAQRCLEPGQAKCTFGTGAFLLTNSGATGVRSAHGLTCSVAWRVRGRHTYCLDGQVYTAGSAIRWLVDVGILDRPTDLDRVAADDSQSVLCVPAFAGLAAPWWRADARAVFTGLQLGSGRGEIVRAVVDGLAATVAELADEMAAESLVPLQSLRVDGGLTASAALMQAVADLLQVPVEIHPAAHATAMGAAALAALALDPGLGIDQAVGEAASARIFMPVWSADRAGDYRNRWRAALGEGVQQ